MRKGQANPKLAEINRSLEHREAVSKARREHRNSPKTEFKEGTIPPFKGKHVPLEVKEKIRAANTGKHHTEETKALLSALGKDRHLSEEHKNKISVIQKGRPHSEEHNAKMIKSLKGRHLHPETEIKKGQRISPGTELTSERVKSWWRDPEYRAKVIAGKLKNRRPTGPEKEFIKIIERHSLPFKYTGDGSFILEGLNPDFIEINGRKIAIDIFGDYWHTLKADRESYTEDGRKAIFAKYGWALIVIWESELKSMTEKAILRKIGGVPCKII